MFKNVLIAEDHESASISVRKTLDDLGVTQKDYVYYCDDALQRVKKAVQSGQPFELLITDLYFEEDHCAQQIIGGAKLIEAVKKVQPDIKVLVFSAEPKAAVIEMLYNETGINGYVKKARHDAQQLKIAIEQLAKNKQYFPPDFRQVIKQKNAHAFTDFDITIITLLSKGMLQKDIPTYLLKNDIKPSGLSSLEKRLNHIKETLEFSKNEQLVAFCKDMGII